jgi:hypothetical protein
VQSSHAHQWWPPQLLVERLLPGTKLPIGTNRALELLAHAGDELFAEADESAETAD